MPFAGKQAECKNLEIEMSFKHMNLIVFDLEWNIGYQPKTFDYHGTEQTLRGEIIQIGAVKIDANAHVLDTFRINLKPRIFKKLQHHIAKVTGMTQNDLDMGVPIREGLQQFVRWAGPDAAFAEWGMDDVPVLKQNLYLCKLDESWPNRWYDLQRVFLSQSPRKEGEGMTLESVVTRLEIPTSRPFHDALADALYTVDVCRRLDLEKGLAEYPTEEAQMLESLCPDPDGDYRDIRYFFGYLERETFRDDAEMQTAPCPDCGRTLSPDEFWFKRGNTGYYTLAECECGKKWFIRFKLARRDGLHWNFARCLEAPTQEGLQKWTKQKHQQQERLKRRLEKTGEQQEEA